MLLCQNDKVLSSFRQWVFLFFLLENLIIMKENKASVSFLGEKMF